MRARNVIGLDELAFERRIASVYRHVSCNAVLLRFLIARLSLSVVAVAERRSIQNFFGKLIQLLGCEIDTPNEETAAKSTTLKF